MISLKFLSNSPFKFLITGWRYKKGDGVLPATEDPTLDSNPLRAAYVRSVPDAQLFRGVLLQGYLAPADILIGLENMSIREDDVFVITYPKSGTTWTEEIMSLIYNDGDIRKVQNELLIYRVHHLEVGRPFGQLRYLKNLRSPRLMATHLPLPLIPKQLRQAKCKIVYVVRNPKDTAVSYYHHHKMSTFLGNYEGTWDEFLQHFMAGHLVYDSWFDHVLPYWNFCKQHPDKVFFLSYEELKMDLKGMITRLCQFLGRKLSDSSIETICKHCSFEQMKTNTMVNREKLPITDLFDMSKTKFMRKGIIGDWKNYFTPEQSEAFDKIYKDRMANSELELVFEPEDAIERFNTYGRVIYNHPEVSLQPETDKSTLSQEFKSPEDNEVMLDQRYTPIYDMRHNLLPSMQIHAQPDPLTLIV